MHCSICGEDLFKSRTIARKDEIRFKCYNTRRKIVECKNCKTVQLIPQWSDKELEKIYKNYNQQKDFSNQKTPSDRISKYIKRYINRNYSILEVGCGSGSNVRYLTKHKYHIVGIDKDFSVTDEKAKIYCNDIFDKELDNAKYDFIYGLHILEHMKDPIKFISRLKDLLKDNGTILLEFPNLEDPLLTIYKIKEFEKFYYRPDHHFFYTIETVSGLLYRNKIINCTVERKQNYGIVNHLNWLIRKKPTNLKINIPILDNLYKWYLCRILKKSDTIVLTIKKEK